MMNQNSCDNSSGVPCSSVQIVQSADVTFFTRLFYSKTGEPFDLTGATEIVALFPGADGTPVKKTLTNSGGVTVVGAPGAGKIQIALTTTDTEAMQPNTQIQQNLQVIVIIAGVAQVDTISFGSPPVSGTTYTVTLNGSAFSYKAKDADTAQDVFNALKILIDAALLPISTSVTGSSNTAHLVLTSTIPSLGFTDQVSAGMTLTPTTPNGGARTVFLLQQVLNIQPQDYAGS